MNIARPLREFLRLKLDVVEVDPKIQFPIAGVYGHGRGLFERGPMAGSATSYKKLHRLHAGQLVVSRLKAFEGALAIVPSTMEGWYLSPEFPTFECVEGELDHRYLAQLCRWADFWSMLAATSKGIGARRERVHVEDLLNIRLRIPHIDEQRLVATRLDWTQSSTEDLRRLSDHAMTVSNALSVAVVARPDIDDSTRISEGWRRTALGEILRPSRNEVEVRAEGEYQIAGLYSFGRGLIDRGSMSGAETSYKSLTVLDEGDIVVSKLNGWEGAVTVVGPRFAGHCVSSEYPTFKADPAQLRSGFFAGIARSPWFWEALNANTRGSMVRRRRINSTEFLATEIWLPPTVEQERISELLATLDLGMAARSDATAIATALTPAALNQAFAALNE